MPSLTQSIKSIASLGLCVLSTLTAAFAVDTLPDSSPADSRAKSKLLSPLTIDQTYLRGEIPAESGGKTITLHGAVEEAAVHNREVREANLEVSRFKWDYLAVQTTRLPNIRVTSYLAEQTVNSLLIPARPDAFVMLSAFFPITQQYRIGLEAKVIKLAGRIAAERLRKQLDETSAKVKAAYYKLAIDQSHLADVEDSIQYLNELATTVAEQIKRGNSLKVDAMQVEARTAKAQVEETKAKDDYGVDREKFNHLLGRDLKSSVALEVIPPADDFELNVDQAESQALSMRPEIGEAQARVQQVRAEKQVIMSEYIPNVSIGVLYLTLPGFNNTIIPTNVLAPGLFINWNAFDWGKKLMAARARGKVEQEAKLTTDSVKEDVLIDLHTQMNKLKEARQLVGATRLAQAASREEMRVSLNRYKHTSAQLSDVLQAQSNLSDASNNYHQALLGFWEARAQFERALGVGE